MPSSKKIITKAAAIIVLCSFAIIASTLITGEDSVQSDLVINEIVCSNTNQLLGLNEQYYDWIELKNVSQNEISLSGCYLSNEKNNPEKWAFPDVSIPPQGILVIYASELSFEENTLLADFNLSKNGSFIGVYNGDKYLAALSVPALNDNISYGLNGNNNYVYFSITTFGEENYPEYYNSQDAIGQKNSAKNFIRFNEFSVGKQQSVYDEDGDFSDFIELYNTSGETINLSGYCLSDDSGNPTKFRLPQVEIQPDGYLIIFASGKNKWNNGYIHTNFKISANETIFLYDEKSELIEKIDLPALPENVSYGRNIKNENEWLYYSAPTPGMPNDTTGLEKISESKTVKGSKIFISEAVSANAGSFFDGYGNNEDWIELYNQTETAISLKGWYLSDNIGDPKKWAFGDSAVILPGQYMIIFASGKNLTDPAGYAHTNFSLNKYNQQITLSMGDVIMDVLAFGVMKGDVSAGIGGTFDAKRYYFEMPTPAQANNSAKYNGVSGQVVISQKSGSYTQAVNVSLSCTDKNAAIYYTLDGSTPDSSSFLYSGNLLIDHNTSLRAVSYKAGSLYSEVATATYLFNTDSHGLPVVFLTTDDSKLFNGGIYNENLNDDREVDANIELIETDGEGFNKNVLISKSGNMSIFEPQKSFSVSFKESAGDSRLYYDLFPDDPDGVTEFKSFLLRTSGNDWDDLKCKDGMLQTLAMTQMDLDYMSYRPAVLYINSEYWGIYNIRDKQNEDYLATHHPGVDADNVDIISFGYGIHEGDYTEYNKMMDFIANSDLDDAANWAVVESMIDVDNLIDTYLCHIYYGNYDTVNIKWWRERKEGAKWRWFLYDLDYALYAPYDNELAYMTDPEGHGVNKSFDSSLLVNLMKSHYFRERFMQRTSKYWNTVFNADTILEHFSKIYAVIAPEMPHQLERWDIGESHLIAEMNEADDFIRKRPEFFRIMFKNYFHLTNEELNALLPQQTISYPKIVIN